MAIKRNFAVVGLGSFGFRLCEILSEGGGNVIAIDRDNEAIERVKNFVSVAMLLDTTDENSLMKAPLDDVDIAIVAIGDNTEASILTTALLKQKNIPFVLARSISPLHASVLRSVGANEVLNIEVSSATALAHRLIAPDVMESMMITNDISIKEMIIPKVFSEKTLEEIGITAKFNIKIVALVRTEMDIDIAGNSIPRKNVYYPDENFVFKSADHIFVLGRNHDLTELLNI